MPRANAQELEGFLTTTQVAKRLSISRFVLKARIADGILPPATRTTESNIQLFDQAWLDAAMSGRQEHGQPLVKRVRSKSSALALDVKDVLGHTPGEDGWIPTWAEVVTWFETLAAASDRVVVETEGTSTDGRPYLTVYVSAPENLTEAARSTNRDALETLRDPRRSSAADRRKAIGNAKTVGVILASQHSNEIGSLLMSMHLAQELAAATDEESLAILDQTVTVIVPSHNPDGVDLIGDWYRRWKGTEHDGVEMPWLYHPFVGHDNNRDWFMMTQVETRHYVTMHNREHPQAVFDMHQMGRFGPRYMVPPFIDPLDPNQDPVIQQGFATLGTHIAQRLTAAGKAGVVINAIFDNYSPSLAYGNYHGSVDLLSEAASAKLVSPVKIGKKELDDAYGIDPTKRLWNQPMPWEPGDWTIGDIVSYNLIAARAFLNHLARNRRQWLSDYADLHRRIIDRTDGVRAYVVPPDQRDPRAAAEMLDIMHRGQVERQVATESFTADGISFPAGSTVIRLDQPAAAFARTLLEVQTYPDVRRWKDAPKTPPYDITGHTLPIQMGVDVVAISGELASDLPLVTETDPPNLRGEVEQAPDADTWIISGQSNSVVSATTALVRKGVEVHRVRARNDELGLEAGDALVRTDQIDRRSMKSFARESGAQVRGATIGGDVETWRQSNVRLGVFQPWTASMDEGWARWVLNEYGVPYETVRPADLRQGDLRSRFDVLLIPDMNPADLIDGHKDTSREGDPYPPEYLGGLGDAGKRSLRAFVGAGGTLIAVDHVSPAVIDILALPVSLPLSSPSASDFSCPGSLLQVVIDNKHPLGVGLPRELPVLFLNSKVFSTSDASCTSVAKYPQGNPLLSGWLDGAKHIAGTSALVDAAYGDGRVVLIGFRPYFRAQARSTYRVLFNAIQRAGFEETTF